MITYDETSIKSCLSTLLLPDSQRFFGEFDVTVRFKEAPAVLTIELPFPFHGYEQVLCDLIQQKITPATQWRIEFQSSIQAHLKETRPNLRVLPQVKNVIVVASGKGGVGKSTIAANLALQLNRLGAQVGVLDADIYGPNQGLMLGLCQPYPQQRREFLEPLVTKEGLKVMSMAFLIEQDQAVIWRGPMLSKTLQQLLFFTRWGLLDYLVIDLPPGTGDVQLTLIQKIPISSAIVVTTPQPVAVADASKAIQMFKQVSTPIAGLVENMSYFVCPHCDNKENLFGEGGGEYLSKRYQIDLLGQLPLASTIRQAMDKGDISLMQVYLDDYRRIAWRTALHVASLPT